MAPLIALLGLFGLFSSLGLLGVSLFAGWYASLRFALAGMFLLTASAHWGKRRADLIRMVPPALPQPGMLVTATGVLELLGAFGLMVPSLARYASGGLALLLLAMFPANVHAARARLSIAGRPVTPLGPRTAMQVVFLAATIAVFAAGLV